MKDALDLKICFINEFKQFKIPLKVENIVGGSFRHLSKNFPQRNVRYYKQIESGYCISYTEINRW